MRSQRISERSEEALPTSTSLSAGSRAPRLGGLCPLSNPPEFVSESLSQDTSVAAVAAALVDWPSDHGEGPCAASP